MADEVRIPLSLDVESIQVEDIDIRDVEEGAAKKLDQLAMSIAEMFNNIDTSSFTGKLETEFNKLGQTVGGAYQKFDKFRNAMLNAGESSDEYKAALSNLDHQIQTSTMRLDSMLRNNGTGLYDQQIDELADKILKLKEVKINPLDYVSTAGTKELQELAKAYEDFTNQVLVRLPNAQAKVSDTLSKGKLSDDYVEAGKAVDKLGKKMETLYAKMQKMEATGTGTANAWTALQYDVSNTSDEMGQLIAQMQILLTSGKAFNFGETPEEIEKHIQALWEYNEARRAATEEVNAKTDEKLGDYTPEYQKQLANLAKIDGKISKINDRFAQMNKYGANGKMWDKLRTDAGNLEAEVQTISDKLVEMVRTGVAFRIGKGDTEAELTTITEQINQLVNLLAGIQNTPNKLPFMSKLRSVANIANMVNRSVASLGKGIKSLISKFNLLGKAGKRGFGQVNGGMRKSFKNILMYVFGFRSLFFLIKRLRTTFTQALNTMAQQVPKVNNELSLFNQALRSLKASLATAFQPVVSVVIPILNQFMSYLTECMNSVGSFFAVLTGQKYIYKATAALEDYAAALDGTKDKLASYDKLDVINKDSNNGNTISGITFEKADAEKAASEFAELVKAAWKKIDFTEVGAYIGEQFNTILDSISNWLTMKAAPFLWKIATDLGTLINGFIDVDGLGTNIGNTIAQAFNIAFDTLNTFLITTNWSQLGIFLADVIMGAITGFDWSLLGRTVADAITAGISTWYSFITTFDFTGLGDRVAESINSFLTNMSIPDEAGMTVWEKFGASISNTVEGLLTFIKEAVSQVDWASVGTAIGEFMSGIDWGAVIWDFTGLITAFIKGLGEAFLNWAETDPLSAGILGVFLTAIAGLNVALIVGPLATKLQPIAELASNLGIPFGELLKTVGTKIGGIGAIVGGAITFVTGFFDAWSNGVSPMNAAVTTIGALLVGLGLIILGVVGWPALIVAAVVAGIALLLSALKNGQIQAWWNDTVLPFFDSINTAFDEKIVEPLVEKIVELKKKLTEKASEIKQNINTWIDERRQKINDFFLKIVEKLAETKNKLSTTLSNIKKSFSDTITGIKKTVTETVDSLWKSLKNKINTMLSGIEKFANGIISAINAALTAFNRLKVDIPDEVPFIGGVSLGFNFNKLSKVSIPRLAQGGVIPPNKEFLALLGDQNSGTNIEAPLDTIKQALAEVLAEVGTGNHEPIVLQLDGKIIARTVWDESAKRYKQTGKAVYI